MSDNNPLLADTALPAFSRIRPEHIAPAISAILADYGRRSATCVRWLTTRPCARRTDPPRRH